MTKSNGSCFYLSVTHMTGKTLPTVKMQCSTTLFLTTILTEFITSKSLNAIFIVLNLFVLGPLVVEFTLGITINISYDGTNTYLPVIPRITHLYE